MKIQDYLSEQGVDFTVKHHEKRYTALEEAEAQHVSGEAFAKTVVVKVSDQYTMLVLSASCRVILSRLEELLGGEATLATEQEMAELFPDCEVGAEPPFGSRYGMRTLVDERLAKQERIAIRACSHEDVVDLSYADFARLENPQVAAFAERVE